ncbi:MAG: methyltransferase [Actinobacteria bacterium]|nr:methyltransferase [Actinomycetota bacterium]|tara:strand:+ start:2423 stop:3067 length:645 start_codon:yes stop_codon:yes gene_type:complete
MVGFLSDELENYITEHSEKTGSVEQSLRKETLSLGPPSGMMSGDSVGNFLKFLVQINHCKRILEIGTFTGYSALMMASALPESGELITCDVNSKTSKIAQNHWNKSPHGGKIKLILGEALNTLGGIGDSFDLIFIDADKNNYYNYFEICKKKLSNNGIMVVDNVLWSGRVLNPEDDQTESIDTFNKKITADKAFWNTIIPIRDGLMIIKRKNNI